MDAGMKTLSDDGLAKVRSGLTTFEEAVRVVIQS
jgi:type II secretory ATPase GspE/PulE/Tfp pilus assembly ATPase PilB-like protein